MRLNLSTLLPIALAGLLAFVASSCGANRILIEPPASQVKKVALISVTAKRGVRNLEGGGKFSAGLSALSSLTAKSGAGGVVDFGGTELVEHAKATFESEIGKVPGWEVVSTDAVKNAPAYHSFNETYKSALGGMVGALSSVAAFGPDGMAVIPDSDGRGFDTTMFANLAKALDVDAVAVMNLDVAYLASTSIGGTGTATGNVGIGLIVVHRDGGFAINVTSTRSQYRARSGTTAPIVAGNMLWTDAASRAFRESVTLGMAKVRGDILHDMANMKKK